MRKLIYEDINLTTKYSYRIYRTYENKYLVYEDDEDCNTKYIGEMAEDAAYKFVRERCK